MIPRDTAEGNPLIIAVAPTGAETTRRDNPALPHTPKEIAREVVSASEVGATVAHLHVREPDGTPSSREELFAECVALIRQECDIITQVSTGGATGMTIEERSSGLLASPDMSGIEVGSINFFNDLFQTLPNETEAIARVATESGIALEIETFDLGQIDTAIRLHSQGILPEPLRFNLVFGVPGAVAANAHNLFAMADAAPSSATWGVTAIGRHQTRMLTLGLLLGAHCIRVGLEDAVYISRGRLASSNAELVTNIRKLAESLGRPTATITEAREILSVPRRTLPT